MLNIIGDHGTLKDFDLMKIIVKINWKEFFRDRVWFGYEWSPGHAMRTTSNGLSWYSEFPYWWRPDYLKWYSFGEVIAFTGFTRIK